MEKKFFEQIELGFKNQPLSQEVALLESEIQRLPLCIQKYLYFVGAVGKPKIQNFRADFEIELKKAPDAKPMKGNSSQFNFLENPIRLFYLKVKMLGLPVTGLHCYKNEKASMLIKLFSLIPVAEAHGEIMDKAETVTFLNDICLMAPSALIDPRFSFKEISNSCTEVYFHNHSQKISATLFFGDQGELINFESNDRPARQDDGSFMNVKFSTPIFGYKDIEGRKIITEGDGVYHYPSGDFAYGNFKLKNISYNLKSND